MKANHWYVVDVSYKESNPTHRAICKYREPESILYGNYEDPIKIDINNLYYFNVVSTIPKMNSAW